MKEKSCGEVSLAKKMGIGSLIASAVFFFNPCINIIDPLPDFFGVVLLINGLRKWGDLCPGMSDAIQGLMKLRWLMLLKMLFMALVPIVDDTYVLIFTFGFAILELIYMLPAIVRIFDGFEYVGKSVLVVLPELCSLSSYEYSGYVTAGVQIDFARYKYPLLGVGIFLTALTGILWLVSIIPYWKRIGNDKEFMKRVSDQYDLEVGNDIGLAFRRALYTVLALITAAPVFFLNMWFDGMNVIPNFLGGLLLVAAMWKLSKFTTDIKPAKIVCVAFTAVSAVSFAVSTVFSALFELDSIYRNFAAYDLYNVSRILSAVEYALMLASVFMVIKQLRRVIIMHLGPDPDTSDRRLIDIYTAQQRELDRRYVVAFVLFVVVFVLNIVYLMFRADIDFGAPQFWLVPFLANGIWWIYMKSVNDQLYSQVEYKYM